MLIQVLKSKLKKVRVTGASTEYEGSLTLDPELMMRMELSDYERVEVNAVNGKARLSTYVIPGEWGSGQVEMNGGMANFFKPGDEVHVNCFMYSKPHKLKSYRYPLIIKTDENNKIIE